MRLRWPLAWVLVCIGTAALSAPPGDGRLRGTVRDARGPVAGARVEILEVATDLPRPWRSCGLISDEDPRGFDCRKEAELRKERMVAGRGSSTLVAAVLTDAAGRYDVRGLPSGDLALWVAASESGASLRPRVRPTDADVDIVLGRGRRFDFVVVDGSEVPQEGVRVTLMEESVSRALSSVTDTRGHASFSSLSLADYGVLLQKAGFRPVYERLELHFRDGPLRVRLQRTGGITGEVRWKGRPAAGVRVAVDGAEVARTDQEGRFILPEISAGPHGLSASNEEGYARMWLRPDGEHGSQVSLALEPWARVTVEVLDERGTPIDGATVHAETSDQGRLPKEWKTDSRGQALLRLPEGAYEFDVEAAGFSTSEGGGTRLSVAPGQAVTTQVVLSTPVRFEGHVLDGSGAPITGAKVTVMLAGVWKEARTGRDGAFGVAGIPVGKHRLVVEASGYAVTASQVEAPQRDLVVRLARGATLRVRVLDEVGQPLAHTEVDTDFEPVRYLGTLRSETNEQGVALLADLPAGVRLVRVARTERYLYQWLLEERVRLSEGEHQELTMSFQRLALRKPLQGTVTDAEGRPLQGIRVEARPSSEPASESAPEPYSIATTGPDGAYVLDHLPDVEHQVSVFAEAFQELAPATVPRHLERLDLTLTRLGTIRGRVLRPDGQPQKRFKVEGRSIESDDGGYEVPVRQSGIHELRIEAEGFAPERVQVVARDSGSVQARDVRLETLRTVYGRVTRADGTPAAYVGVDAEEVTERPEWSPQGESVRTDGEGRFTFAAVARKPLRVSTSDAGEAALATVAADGETVTLRMRRGAQVVGHVRDAEGKPVAGARVKVWCGTWPESRAEADATGQYRVPVHGSGDCVVAASRPARWEERGYTWPPPSFTPRRVRIPEKGQLAVELSARSGSGALHVQLPYASEWLLVYLFRGKPKLPDSFGGLYHLAAAQALEDEPPYDPKAEPGSILVQLGSDTSDYARLEPGLYTVVVVEQQAGGASFVAVPVQVKPVGTTELQVPFPQGATRILP